MRNYSTVGHVPRLPTAGDLQPLRPIVGGDARKLCGVHGLAGRLTHASKVGMTSAEDEWFLWGVRADPRFGAAFSRAREIPGWYPEPAAAAAFTILSELRPRCVVEIGSYLGRSTTFLAMVLEQLETPGHVVAIDPHTGDRQQLERLGVPELPSLDLFHRHIQAAGLSHRVVPVVKPAHQAAGEWTDAVDFLFVDGWHSYDAVMEDGRDWLPHLSPKAVVVFDDVGHYPEVQRAVEDLAAQGCMHLYGEAFHQAFGGISPSAPGSVRRVLRAHRPLSSRLQRLAAGMAGSPAR